MRSDNKNEIDNFLSTMISKVAYPSKENLRFKYNQIFDNIYFKGKNVLEIGGGHGVFCFYAAVRGANWVVNLEPEGDGSKSFYIKNFKELQDALGVNNVELVENTFQKYDSLNRKFDIILLYNSINHLDEEACITLLKNPGSWDIYKNIFKRIYTLSNNGAKIILADCSNKNFFPKIGLQNPFCKKIEWHKHQTPDVWIKLLKECGFSNPEISWTTFNCIRNPGKLLFGNRYLSYFLISHFILKMDKSN